ncbi:MAG TPA: CpXC domain-containing protein [Candidatus Aquabacterium excrementipullorum]|nr:CpXC domain-containing protein [Candidatus Aquabacterium excrementipullorum]
MSIFHHVQAACGHCGQRNDVARTASVNAGRRPDLRAAILDGSFQRETCVSCGTVLRLPPHLTYIDMARGQWFLVESAEAIERWQTAEKAARETHDRAFGSRAAPHARELGETLRARLVLGWTALREQLWCDELGLDDITLELLKLDLLGDMESAPLADQTELRLVVGDAETLRFDWIELATERPLEGVEVPRSVYDELVAQADDWAGLRARFDGALLVDWRRLTFEATPA